MDLLTILLVIGVAWIYLDSWESHKRGKPVVRVETLPDGRQKWTDLRTGETGISEPLTKAELEQIRDCRRLGRKPGRW